ncbi:MAG: tRNA (adenosine(37)-N6)-threonylcarbamoyltransferase complex ATPase subunit type 1 TsaE [Legionellaceae bacterium]|nr:tRNA (adenosine(37)-N6)-threonylcarbamoyltransferase complex ATPase subunit type 1 TsaE [Legionellaceae bacterium]
MLFHLPSEYESEQFAERLAACLVPPLILTFSGDIGMGKTTLIRALLRSMGVTCAIKSPTFTLVESYDLGGIQFNHFDLYRIHDETELDYIGFRDYFGAQAICCIEWPERVSHCFDRVDLAFTLVRKEEGRDMRVCAFSSAGTNLLSCIVGES